jgi:hypothetical protein
MPNYDASAEVTLKVTIEDVEEVEGCCAWHHTGTHLSVRAEDEKLSVHVGPTDYLAEHGLVLEKGDEIELTASRVTCMGDEILIPRKIRKDDQTVKLRDKRGVPEWSGRKRN